MYNKYQLDVLIHFKNMIPGDDLRCDIARIKKEYYCTEQKCPFYGICLSISNREIINRSKKMLNILRGNQLELFDETN